MIDGILAVDKPPGWTSHDIVARVRRLSQQKQVGHAGTLDPLATGLLLVVLGRATRFSDMLMGSSKTYRAEIVFGVTTNTDDAEGTIQLQRDPSALDRNAIEAVLPRFLGEIQQRPPTYAAIKQGGKKLYQLARQGIEVHASPRHVSVHEIEVERWELPRLRVLVRCGPGTYIRALARDLGAELGVGGYLHALRRLRSGRFDVVDAYSPDQLEGIGISAAVLPTDRAVASLPALVVDRVQARLVCTGISVPVGEVTGSTVRVYSLDGDLLALARVKEGMAHPFRVVRTDTDASRR